MDFFKLGWLSSKERKELNALRNENKALTKKSEALVEKFTKLPELDESMFTVLHPDKPYKNLFYNNDTLTVVFHDKTILHKTPVNPAEYVEIKNAQTRDEIEELMGNKQIFPKNLVEVDTPVEIEEIKKSLDIFNNNPDFEVVNGELFLKGVSIPVPTVIAGSFIEILEKSQSRWHDFYHWVNSNPPTELEESYEALKMFWLKLALNGLEQSRQDLLSFVRKNDVKITRNGNLVLYRRIVSLKAEQAEKDLIAFISQEYFKIKKWKKSPVNYQVFKVSNDGKKWDYILGSSIEDSKVQDWNTQEAIGNLSDLYKNLDKRESNKFTSAHNKGKYTIQVGTIYKENESNINLDNGNCAAGGLHAAAVDYDYSGFGDTPVVVLVNPSKAITVPVNDFKKLRTTEMFIAAINDKSHGTHFDDSTLSSFDEEYNNLTVAELEDALKNKSFAPASVLDKVSPITFLDLEHIKNMLKDRVQKI